MGMPISKTTSLAYIPADEKFKIKSVHHIKVETAQERRIKQEIDAMQQWEDYVKQHELEHAMIGGSHVGSISYVYRYGPDGRKYVVGGQVSVSMPKGLNHTSLNELEKLKNATTAPTDLSTKDMVASAIISAVYRSRTNKMYLKQAIDKYERQAQMKAAESIKNGSEIFVYKKFDISSTRLLELFV